MTLKVNLAYGLLTGVARDKRQGALIPKREDAGSHNHNSHSEAPLLDPIATLAYTQLDDFHKAQIKRSDARTTPVWTPDAA